MLFKLSHRYIDMTKCLYIVPRIAVDDCGGDVLRSILIYLGIINADRTIKRKY